MRRFKRIIVIVLHSVGIGATADPGEFGDQGADTLGHVCQYWQGTLKLPTLTRLGLGNIPRESPLMGVSAVKPLTSQVGKMKPASADIDSLNGHWELMGTFVNPPLDTFPNGFPLPLINRIETFSNRKVLLNRPASVIAALKGFGEQESKEGDLIVYSSNDSVLQVSTNEAVVSVNELYRICRYIRFMVDESRLRIGRIIARPFVGESPSDFKLTNNRQDLTIVPPTDTALELLTERHVPVAGIGSLIDLFSGRGITTQFDSRESNFKQLLEAVKTQVTGLVFADLGSLDEAGHARNPRGYGLALMQIDSQLNKIMAQLTPTDLMMITADQGNDPTYSGTGHTREYVPLIAASPNANGGQLGIRSTLSDLGATILSNFKIHNQLPGTSFLDQIS